MVEPPLRLLLVAHGVTAAASELVFGDEGPLLHPGPLAPPRPPVASWWSGPERACRQTLDGLGGSGEVLPGLAGPDLGDWDGRPLAEVAASDPAGLQAWLGDPDARPHGGETLAELVARLAALLSDHGWPAGTSALVVTPLVARALAVAALGAPPAVVFALDVGHGGRVLLSGRAGRWRLQELLRRPGSPDG